MVGFSIVPINNNNGYGCFFDENHKSVVFYYNKNSIKIWLDKLIESQTIILVTDSHQLYNSLSFLGINYLQRLNIFDCKAFINVFKNATNIDIFKIGKNFYSIDNEIEKERIEKIWMIQGEQNWDHIPISLIEIYLEKNTALAYKLGKTLKKNQLPIEQSVYYDFLKEFILYLTFLEKNGIVFKTNELIIPFYEYDHTITGRLINTKPFCFQTISQKKFTDQIKSRFGNEGIIIIADWSNADFRVAAALSQEKINKENKDPYILLGKKILNKEIISDEERTALKSQVLSIMYGYDNRASEIFYSYYPSISKYRKFIISEAKIKKQLTTYLGKTRFFSQNDNLETKAFNTINQMTVADLCKKAIIETQKEFEEKKFKSVMIPYIVYDKFCFDVFKPELENVIKSINSGLINKTFPYDFKKWVDFDIKIESIM